MNFVDFVDQVRARIEEINNEVATLGSELAHCQEILNIRRHRPSENPPAVTATNVKPANLNAAVAARAPRRRKNSANSTGNNTLNGKPQRKRKSANGQNGSNGIAKNLLDLLSGSKTGMTSQELAKAAVAKGLIGHDHPSPARIVNAALVGQSRTDQRLQKAGGNWLVTAK